MKCNPERFIEALIAVEMIEMHHQQAAKKEKQRLKAETCVVTVSRDFGSMGKLVAQRLAEEKVGYQLPDESLNKAA